MANNSIFTEEEKAEDKKDVLELLKVGTPYSVICDELGRSMNYIKKIKEELIQNGEIIQEEIDKARAEYRRNRIEKQMLSKPKKEEKINSRAQTKIKNKQIILEKFKQGYTQTEIAEFLQVGESYVQRHKDELIAEGLLLKNEIKRANSNKESINRNEKICNKYLKRVLAMQKEGIKPFLIRKNLGITAYEMEVVSEHIRYNKLFSQDEYEKAKQEREQIIMGVVEKSVKAGKAIKDMINDDPFLYEQEVSNAIKQLIEKGKITREQVEENKIRKFKESRNSGAEMSVDEQTDFVFKLAKKGYTPREIADLDKTDSIDFNKATRIKKDLIKRGILNNIEVNKAIQDRKNAEIRKKHEEEMKKIIRYTKKGYTETEMTVFLGYTKRHISELKTEYREKHGWFTKEELSEFKKARHKREEHNISESAKEEREKEQIERQHKDLKDKACMQYKKQQKGLIDEDENDNIKAYLDFLRYINTKNIKIDEEEIEFSGKLLLDNISLISIPNLRFIVTKYYMLFGLEKATKYINRVSGLIDDKELIFKLRELKNTLAKIDKRDKMIEMYNEEKNVNEIANYFGLTYDDTVKVMKGNIKLEFDEEVSER